MAKRFNINALPEDVRAKISYVIWNCDDFPEEFLGQVDLKDGWVFDDGSHITLFKSKSDLIRIVRSARPE